MPKGKLVKSTSKSIICNLHDYLIGKVRNGSPLHLSLCKKTDEATGFSERTVNRVLLEKRKLDGSSFTSPNKRCKESREHVDVILVTSKRSY